MREGWISDKFSNCFKLKSGDNLTKKNMQEGPYPVYGGNGIAGHDSEFNLDGQNLLIGRVGALCGNVRFVNEKIWLTDNAFKVEDTYYDFDYRFLEYLLNFLNLKSYARQTAQPVISNSSLKKVRIEFPESLPEQKRIVAILDQAFEAIEQAKANVERNNENAEELFQSKLNAIFSLKGEDWVSNKLRDITTKIGSGATPREGKKNYKESGISLIRSLNVYDEGFEEEKLAFIDEEQAGKLSNVELYKGDVLLNITGASVARCCVVPEKLLPARVNQHVSIIRIEEGVMDKNFLHYLLISKFYKDKLLGIGEQGATRQAITKAQIRDFEVSYPSKLSEQKKLIKIIDKYRDLSIAIKGRYETKLRSIEDLKKSILQKAFSGELTANETIAL